MKILLLCAVLAAPSAAFAQAVPENCKATVEILSRLERACGISVDGATARAHLDGIGAKPYAQRSCIETKAGKDDSISDCQRRSVLHGIAAAALKHAIESSKN